MRSDRNDEGVAGRQARLNRSVAAHSALFAEHRRATMRLVSTLAPANARVAWLLGVGNGYDLDLNGVAGIADRVHLVDLVDLDAEAILGFRDRRPGPPRFDLHGGVDVTGLVERFDRWIDTPPDDAEIDGAVMTVPRPPGLAEGSGDIVVSLSMLSQLTGTAVRVLGTGHPRAVELALAVRDAHLDLLVRLTSPGGVSLLVTDVAGSMAIPELLEVDPADLPSFLDEVVAERTFLTGTSPVGIEHTLRHDPAFVDRVDDVQRHPPWRWQVLPGRVQLVIAVSFRRATG